MNANIYGKKTVAALIAAVMVLCGMAVIMSESADAEPEFNAGAVAEGFMDTISLADPYRTLVEDVDITDAVVFDGSTLELNADTVYSVRDGTVVDLVGKELVLGAGATLYFEGNAKIDLGGGSEQGTIAFGEDSRFAAPGFTFFNDLFDASAEPTRVLACNGNPILVKTVVDQYGSGFGIGSES
ncbi:MAG: hypothetical protein MJZ38_05320, partial [archaeon]|nr:hypothetical protein [archaeon]